MSAEPISLYLDLEPGKVAELEVVARASLAWAAAIKDVAYVVDPSLDLRIEIASGTPGSLSIDSILRNLKDHKGEALTLTAIAIIMANWIGGHVLDYGFEKFMEMVTGEAAASERFTPEQHKELEEIVNKAVAGRVAQPHVEKMYRELERDPVIKGAGVTRTPGQRPAVIVPRSEFPRRAGRETEPHMETIQRRVTVEDVRVGLISPVLIPGNRRWKLRSAQGEFGAAIKDDDFIQRVLSGTTSVRMKAGIELDIELETTEEFKGGVWEIVERHVNKVHRLIEPPSQDQLAFFQGNEAEAGDDGDEPDDGDDDGR